MPQRRPFFFAPLSFVALGLVTVCFAQTESEKPFSRLGVAVKASSLGVGIEAATPLTQRSNLRAGFNVFSYDCPRLYGCPSH